MWFAEGEPENVHCYRPNILALLRAHQIASCACGCICVLIFPQPLISATGALLLDVGNNMPLEEFASLKEVKPTENAQVQGIVMSVSPMK